MNIPNGKGILKFKSIIQKEPIFILSGLGIFLFLYLVHLLLIDTMKKK